MAFTSFLSVWQSHRVRRHSGAIARNVRKACVAQKFCIAECRVTCCKGEDFNVAKHPTSLWVVQQLREAFPFELAPRFLIFDRAAKYGCRFQWPLETSLVL